MDTGARFDYVKWGYDYDFRNEAEVMKAAALMETWRGIGAALDGPGGTHQTRYYPKKGGATLLIEAWGEQANSIVKVFMTTMEPFRRFRLLRLDWKVFRDEDINIHQYEAIANAKSNASTSKYNTRKRTKKGDRDKGGQYLRINAIKSARSGTMYKRGDEKPCMELQQRGKVAKELWDTALDTYRAKLRTSGGDVTAAEEAMISFMENRSDNNMREFFEEKVGFDQYRWQANMELRSQETITLSSVDAVYQAVKALNEFEQTTLFDALGLVAPIDAAFVPA